MGYMIEITEKKYDKLSEHIEESLRHLGKAMSCIAEIGEPYGMGHRDDEMMGYRGGRGGSGSGSGSRGGYGGRYGERDDYGMRGGMGYRDDDDDDDEMMGERRRRSRRTGRFV